MKRRYGIALVSLKNQCQPQVKNNMHKKVTFVALSFGFAGAFLAFLDAHRTASRFSTDGVSLGFGPEYSTWFWRHCGEAGIALIAVAFLLEIVAMLLPHRPTKDSVEEPGP